MTENVLQNDQQVSDESLLKEQKENKEVLETEENVIGQPNQNKIDERNQKKRI